MGSFSIWHWFIFMLTLAVPALLFSRIATKAGYPGWWALLGLVPVVNVVALWVFAYSDWPKQPKR
ncbi:hypothetical protein [Janthinobacterium fluminis]|uniref:DUF805 domain-containing protein n=1 Tax=Janthinobacterium fluminis TaxID=2987524 RepID=A0ABT5JUL5_9BURK|nr:hypothetical protein [Janthinobacterium fluminis]MDC8756436.1 hypothetical protein [Janthinobacterium fluminis]